MRYRLAVVAGTAADVVRHAGGWLCDRTMAGWEVTVVLADTRDGGSVEILGASVLDLDTSLAAAAHDPWPHALAVAADLFTADARVRRGLLDCLDHGRAEVVVWGDSVPASLDSRLDTVHHRISVAAQTFKDCALTAVGLPAVAGETSERFRCGELLVTGTWGATDLVQIG
ncbi:hypothetical protein ACFVAV_12775 [Nocardia sp. NPDC057663]|uniref:hypothetical protein n=1 Tax=Nocardia sp. NPDC057663 TaxID=3346201 RepID=UPI0036723E4B